MSFPGICTALNCALNKSPCPGIFCRISPACTTIPPGCRANEPREDEQDLDVSREYPGSVYIAEWPPHPRPETLHNIAKGTCGNYAHGGTNAQQRRLLSTKIFTTKKTFVGYLTALTYIANNVPRKKSLVARFGWSNGSVFLPIELFHERERQPRRTCTTNIGGQRGRAISVIIGSLTSVDSNVKQPRF